MKSNSCIVFVLLCYRDIQTRALFLSSRKFFFLSPTLLKRRQTQDPGWRARLGDDISLHDYSVWCNHGYMLQIVLLYLASTWSHSWAIRRRREREREKHVTYPRLIKHRKRVGYDIVEKRPEQSMSLQCVNWRANVKNTLACFLLTCSAEVQAANTLHFVCCSLWKHVAALSLKSPLDTLHKAGCYRILLPKPVARSVTLCKGACALCRVHYVLFFVFCFFFSTHKLG